MDELKRTRQWFEQAIPEPTIEQACIQIGCHLEETCEMLESINSNSTDAYLGMEKESENFKGAFSHHVHRIEDCDPEALLDAMIDQIVTAIGVCHTMNFDVIGALGEVNRSNFSKFENGKPVFNEQGKIAKGVDYKRPELAPFVGWKNR